MPLIDLNKFSAPAVFILTFSCFPWHKVSLAAGLQSLESIL